MHVTIFKNTGYGMISFNETLKKYDELISKNSLTAIQDYIRLGMLNGDMNLYLMLYSFALANYHVEIDDYFAIAHGIISPSMLNHDRFPEYMNAIHFTLELHGFYRVLWLEGFDEQNEIDICHSNVLLIIKYFLAIPYNSPYISGSDIKIFNRLKMQFDITDLSDDHFYSIIKNLLNDRISGNINRFGSYYQLIDMFNIDLNLLFSNIDHLETCSLGCVDTLTKLIMAQYYNNGHIKINDAMVIL